MTEDDRFLNEFDVSPEERAPFGANWCGPEKLHIHKKTLVASYTETCDGRHVEVFCEALPARFYTVVAMTRMPFAKRSKVEAFSLSTGSGQGKLAADIARAISEGMLDLG